jgi:hypothetical protein
MKSLETFPSTPTACRKLHPSGAPKPVLSVPCSTHSRSATSDIFDQPLTNRGRRHDRSSDDHPQYHSPRSRPSSSPPRHASKRPASRSLLPAAPVKRGKIAQWHNDRAPQGRPKARDYEDTVYCGIIQACHDFEARIAATAAWPDPDKQITWARDAWDIVFNNPDEQYDLSKRMLGLVSNQFHISQKLISYIHRSSLVAHVPAVTSKTLFTLRSPRPMDLSLVTKRIPFGAISKRQRHCLRTMPFITRYHTHILSLYPALADNYVSPGPGDT